MRIIVTLIASNKRTTIYIGNASFSACVNKQSV